MVLGFCDIASRLDWVGLGSGGCRGGGLWNAGTTPGKNSCNSLIHDQAPPSWPSQSETKRPREGLAFSRQGIAYLR